MLEGSIHELQAAVLELWKQEQRCGWTDPATQEVCGEEASHFGWDLVGDVLDDGGSRHRYIWLCHKHYTYHSVSSNHEGLCDQALALEAMLKEARKAETK